MDEPTEVRAELTTVVMMDGSEAWSTLGSETLKSCAFGSILNNFLGLTDPISIVWYSS